MLVELLAASQCWVVLAGAKNAVAAAVLLVAFTLSHNPTVVVEVVGVKLCEV